MNDISHAMCHVCGLSLWLSTYHLPETISYIRGHVCVLGLNVQIVAAASLRDLLVLSGTQRIKHAVSRSPEKSVRRADDMTCAALLASVS